MTTNILPPNSFPLPPPDPGAIAALSGNAPVDGFSTFTPDALMTYCQSRLDAIDGQVQASFDEQNQSAAEAQSIQQAANTFKSFSGANVTSQSDYDTMMASLNTAIGDMTATGATDASSPALAKLDDTKAAMGRTWTHDNLISSTEIQGFAQNLTDAASDLNSSSELQMVQLQSLMSQRQTAISLTTNLVQSLGDQENKVADNIGK